MNNETKMQAKTLRSSLPASLRTYLDNALNIVDNPKGHSAKMVDAAERMVTSTVSGSRISQLNASMDMVKEGK